MVKMRLKRIGAKKAPAYRIVIADSRSPRDGRFIEQIGFYNPMTNPQKSRSTLKRQRPGSQTAHSPLKLSAAFSRSPKSCNFSDSELRALWST